MYLVAMELTIEGHPSVHALGPVTIELPSYMYLLEAEEMSESRTAENRADLILAAGTHPGGDILFITGDGYIREIDHEEHKLPPGPAYPVDFGHGIAIHAQGGTFELASDWAIDNSMSLLSAGVLATGPEGTRVRYVDE